ncbi:MAG: SAM-dependent DNA methyltransferase, partial [Peptostreptococcus porci]|nr:SAM-dependent DNA methyltransferase [Peptostreptococcus porci]
RYWIERNTQSKLAEKLEFFITPKNGEIQYVDEKINPTDLTFFDPCMGFRVIIMTQANSQVNTKVLELLPKFKIKKMNRWCVV